MGSLRLLLALSVVINHCGPIAGIELVGGKIAVQSFFIISGFYMSVVLNEKYTGKNNSYKLFITNRIIRLYPVYLLGLLLAFTTYIIIYLTSNHHFLSNQLALYSGSNATVSTKLFFIVSSLIVLGQEATLYMGINNSGVLYFTKNYINTSPQLHSFLFIPQAWTLSLEMMFYFIAPFILSKNKKLIVSLILFTLILRLYLYNYLSLTNDPWSYRFFPTEFMFFLFGYLSYKIYSKSNFVNRTKLIPWCILLLVFAYSFLYSAIPPLTIKASPFSLNEIVYFTMIILSVPYLFQYFKKNKIDNMIGELSYPTYIFHLLVQSWILIICNKLKWTVSDGSVFALLTMLFALVLNYFIVKPIEKYRQSRVTLLIK